MADDFLFDDAPTQPDPHMDKLAGAFFRVFTGDDGAAVLAHLRSRTIEQPTVPEAQMAGVNMTHLMCLREGENNLLRYMESMVRKGKQSK